MRYLVKNTIGRLLEGRALRSSDNPARLATVLPMEFELRLAGTRHGDRHHVARIGGIT